MSRMFTDQELQEMIVPTPTRLREAYQAGDKEKATALWNKLVDDYMYAFDLRVNWDKAFTDYIYNNLGGDALYEVWRYRGWTEDDIRPMKITEAIRQEGLAMIQAGKAGFLFKSTDAIRAAHPELPAFEEFDDLLRAIEAALG